MTRGRVDWTLLIAGVCVAAFGGVLLADAQGELDLQFVALAPMACAVVGAILLASGITRERRPPDADDQARRVV